VRAASSFADCSGTRPAGRRAVVRRAQLVEERVALRPVAESSTTCPAMQLWPLLCRRIVTTCSAWKRRSARDHSPGTMMIGETPPSSAVIGTDRPGTIARNVASDPVMCTCAMSGCRVR
jgi:hypothetical protein